MARTVRKFKGSRRLRRVLRRASRKRTRFTKKIARVTKAVIFKKAELKWNQDVQLVSADAAAVSIVTLVTPTNADNVNIMFTPFHPSIPQGVGGGNRIGNQIYLKQQKMVLNVRWRATTQDTAVTVAGRVVYRVLCVRPKLLNDYTTMCNSIGVDPVSHAVLTTGTFGTTNQGIVSYAPNLLELGVNWNIMNVLYDSGVRSFRSNEFVQRHEIRWGKIKLQYEGGGDNYVSDRIPYIFVFAGNAGGTSSYALDLDWYSYVSFKDV